METIILTFLHPTKLNLTPGVSINGTWWVPTKEGKRMHCKNHSTFYRKIKKVTIPTSLLSGSRFQRCASLRRYLLILRYARDGSYAVELYHIIYFPPVEIDTLLLIVIKEKCTRTLRRFYFSSLIPSLSSCSWTLFWMLERSSPSVKKNCKRKDTVTWPSHFSPVDICFQRI